MAKRGSKNAARFPSQVYVIRDETEGYLLVSEDTDGIEHGQAVAIYALIEVRHKVVRHDLEDRSVAKECVMRTGIFYLSVNPAPDRYLVYPDDSQAVVYVRASVVDADMEEALGLASPREDEDVMTTHQLPELVITARSDA